MYLDLNRYLDFARKRQTPTTPAVSLFYGLKAALTELKEETVDRRIYDIGEHSFYS
jgi:aspartate aminotransferase-like enzyme